MPYQNYTRRQAATLLRLSGKSIVMLMQYNATVLSCATPAPLNEAFQVFQTPPFIALTFIVLW